MLARISTIFLLATIHSGVVLGAQDLIRVNFRAEYMTLGRSGQLVKGYITERHIISEALGLNPAQRFGTRGYALVYNSQLDSMQVVNRSGRWVVDVFLLAGGTTVPGDDYAHRFTHLFLPGYTNEFGAETNAIGTAVITERGQTNLSASFPARAAIFGRVQFLLTSGQKLGMTNVPAPIIETNDLPMPGFPAPTNGIVPPPSNGIVAPPTNGIPGTNGPIPGEGAITNAPIVTNTPPTSGLNGPRALDPFGSGAGTGNIGTGGATGIGISGTSSLLGVPPAGRSADLAKTGAAAGSPAAGNVGTLLDTTNGISPMVVPTNGAPGAIARDDVLDTPLTGPITNSLGQVFFLSQPETDPQARVCTGIFVGYRRFVPQLP